MLVAFRNNSGQHVWVATMRKDDDACGGEGGGWRTWGWLSLAPGEAKTAFSTSNQFAAFYAEAQDGSSWGDTAGPSAYVTNDPFDNCYAVGHSAPWRVVSMCEINVGWPPAVPGTHTVNLNG